MSNGGGDSLKREGHASNINSAIRQLTSEVEKLEELVAEIQGTPVVQSETKEIAKESIPSVAETMSGTSGRIYKLSERVTVAKNGIKDALY